MTRARDDRRRNNRAAFVEAFTRPDEWTGRAAAAISNVLAGRKEVPNVESEAGLVVDRTAPRVGVEVTPTQPQ